MNACLRNSHRPRVLHEILSLGRDVTQYFEQTFSLSYARVRILARLYHSGMQSQSELQTHLAIDGAAVSRQVALLREAGFVVQTTDAKDSRRRVLALSPQGTELAKNLIRKRHEFEAALLATVSESEVKSFVSVVKKIRHEFERMQDARGGEL